MMTSRSSWAEWGTAATPSPVCSLITIQQHLNLVIEGNCFNLHLITQMGSLRMVKLLFKESFPNVKDLFNFYQYLKKIEYFNRTVILGWIIQC